MRPKSTAKRIAERRQINARLGAQDAAHRCQWCKRNLIEIRKPLETLDGRKFCDAVCRDFGLAARA